MEMHTTAIVVLAILACGATGCAGSKGGALTLYSEAETYADKMAFCFQGPMGDGTLTQEDCAAKDHFGCEDAEPWACAVAEACSYCGKCSVDAGRCIAATDYDCKRSDACSHGRCHAVDGECVALTQDDCEVACSFFGRCELIDGACYPTKPEHCAQSAICRTLGMCALSGDLCVAASDADCAASKFCQHYGQCNAKNGQCVKSD